MRSQRRRPERRSILRKVKSIPHFGTAMEAISIAHLRRSKYMERSDQGLPDARLYGMSADCLRARCRGYKGKQELCDYIKTLEDVMYRCFRMHRPTMRAMFLGQFSNLTSVLKRPLDLSGFELPGAILQIGQSSKDRLERYADFLEEKISVRLLRYVKLMPELFDDGCPTLQQLVGILLWAEGIK